MNTQEFSDLFDLFYNNITSNQAPGLDPYEKSVFLTTAQEEILRAYFNPKENKIFDGFDSSALRLIDFSSITLVFNGTNQVYSYTVDSSKKDGDNKTTYTRTKITGNSTGIYKQAYDGEGKPIADHYIYIESGVTNTTLSSAIFDKKSNTKSITLPDNILAIINEEATVTRNGKETILSGTPLTYLEYLRLSRKPFKFPLKRECWRLINNSSSNKADIIIGPSDTLTLYTIRYIRRPNPIILEPLSGVSINGLTSMSDCELDEVLHPIILKRAVELAKASYMDMNQLGIQVAQQYAMGLSATNMGLVSSK